jgi:maltose O-acetyltransferase
MRLLLCHLMNGFANLFPQGAIGKRIRNLVYRLGLGVAIGRRSYFAGGGYINGSQLAVGDECFINRDYYFDLSAKVSIGHRVSIGTHAAFVTANHEDGGPSRRAGTITALPIVVEDGAWIGTRVTILPGVTIGRGAVVASGAVVHRSVPPNVLVAGVPAVMKRELPT